MPEPRLWQNLWVRLSVALAFADASIVVLALPQLVDRLHTSIGHVVWVIVAYNLALIACCLAIVPVARRVQSRAAVAAITAAAVWSVKARPAEVREDPPQTRSRVPELHQVVANAALTLLAAGLIGALFLVVIEMINGWLVSPIGAAAVVTTIPLSTA